MSIREALDQSDNLYVENNLYYQKNLARPAPFEKLYLLLREKENRLYAENLIKDLPEIPVQHPLQSEWIVRKRSLDRLLTIFCHPPAKLSKCMPYFYFDVIHSISNQI